MHPFGAKGSGGDREDLISDLFKRNMKHRPKFIYLNIFAVLFLYALINLNNPFNKKPQQQNQAPVVKIITPKNNSFFDFDTQVNYEISVADKEDGNSKYDEINAKEVLLEVRSIKNKSKLTALLKKGIQPDVPGIAIMRISNCFNCHNFNSKSIGPSFFEISKKYPFTKPNTDTLVKHIRQGSSGTWGKEKMPTHPELTDEEIKGTVQWILKHAADEGVNYYIGLNGSFRIEPPVASKSSRLYLLIASYVDHGLKTAPGKQRTKGQDLIVISSK
jgi:cytochrome c